MRALLRLLFAGALACAFLAPTLLEAKTARQGRQHKAKPSKSVHSKPTKKLVMQHKKHPNFVRPRLFVPSRGLSDKQNQAIVAYDLCVSGGNDALRHAMDLAYEAKNDYSLKGSPVKLGRETCLAEVMGLTHYRTVAEIARAVEARELVTITSSLIAFPDDVPLERRVARPWVNDYIVTLAKDMERFVNAERVEHSDPLLRIPSTVRSFDVQGRLVRMGRSPANCDYLPICSTHTTGSSIDISLRYLSAQQFAWLEARLRADRKAGKILVISEFLGGHFHMLVIPPEYVAWYHEHEPNNAPPVLIASPVLPKPPA